MIYSSIPFSVFITLYLVFFRPYVNFFLLSISAKFGLLFLLHSYTSSTNTRMRRLVVLLHIFPDVHQSCSPDPLQGSISRVPRLFLASPCFWFFCFPVFPKGVTIIISVLLFSWYIIRLQIAVIEPLHCIDKYHIYVCFPIVLFRLITIDRRFSHFVPPIWRAETYFFTCSWLRFSGFSVVNKPRCVRIAFL